MAVKKYVEIIVDSGDLAKAKKDLDKLYKDLDKDQKAAKLNTDKLDKSVDDLTKSTQKAEDVQKKYSKSIVSTQKEITKNIQITDSYDRAIDNLNNELSSGGISSAKYGKEIAKLRRGKSETVVDTKRLRKELQGLKRDQKDLSVVTGATSGKIGGLRSKTANATPTVVEFSRVIQDAPYGIQGVANNIQQLTTNFGYLKNSAGGTLPALKSIAKSFMGPAGIVFLVSLATTLLVSYGDEILNLASSNKALKKSQDEVNKAINEFYGDAVVKASNYVKVLEDVNTKEDERKNITDELISLIPNLKKEDFEYGNNLDVVRAKIGQYVVAQAQRIEADTLVQENSEKLAKQAKIQGIKDIKDEKERAAAIKNFLKDEGESFSISLPSTPFGGQGGKTIVKSATDIANSFKEFEDELTKELKPINDRIQELYGNAFDYKKPDKEKGSSKKKSEIPLDDEDLDLLEEIRRTDKFTKELEAQMEQDEQMQEFLKERVDNEIAEEERKQKALERLELERTANEQKQAKIKEKTEQALGKAKYNIAYSVLNSISRLAKEGSDLAKGVAVAQATISTYQGINKALAETTDVTPTQTLRFANAAAVGLAGFANVSQILKQDSSGSLSGAQGGQGASAPQAPSFNIVEGTSSNQIAESIQRSNKEPIEAFVVSKKVSNATEFDRQVEQNASI